MLWIMRITLFTIAIRSQLLLAELLPLLAQELAWQQGRVEIAFDPAFQNLLVSFPLSGTPEYLVNWPKTAIYYLRILDQNKNIWQEELFVRLDQAGLSSNLLLSWSPQEQGSSYRIWLQKAGAPIVWAESLEPSIYLEFKGRACLLRLRAIGVDASVRGITGLRVSPASSRSPSKKPIAKPSALPSLDPYAVDEDGDRYEPDFGDLFKDPADSLPKTPGPSQEKKVQKIPAPIVRKHRLSASLRVMREEFQLTRLDRYEGGPSTGLGFAVSGQFYLPRQFSILGVVDTHATNTRYRSAGADAPAERQNRVRAQFGLEKDWLNTFVYQPNWSLGLGFVQSFVQIPFEQDGQKLHESGLRVYLEHHFYRFRFELTQLRSRSQELRLSQGLPWQLGPLKTQVGLFSYRTQRSSAAASGLFIESGLRLGLEYEF